MRIPPVLSVLSPVLLGVGAFHALPAQTTWTLATPATAPHGRQEFPMVYDSVRARVVTFAGFSMLTGDSADTWEWDGTNWLLRTPAHSPPMRAQHALAFDRHRGVTVLFGGRWGYTDTWEWDGIDWTQRVVTSGPSYRNRHMMAYDAARREVVLFGGTDGASPAYPETWTWNGVQWTQRQPTTSPPGCIDAGFAYDSHRERVVLFGGWGNSDTWEWDGSDWTQVATATVPPWRAGGVLAYDSARRCCVLFGGNNPQNDTWEYDGSDWQERFPATTPSPRSSLAAAYDEARRAVVIFGGSNGSGVSLDETWTYAPTQAATSTSFGSPCSGTSSTPVLGTLLGSLPWLGRTFEAEVTGLDPTATFALFSLGSSNQTPLPLDGFGMPGCLLYASNLGAAFVAASSSSARLALTLPNLATLTGAAFSVQAGAPSPAANAAGLLASNALALTIGNP